jgi:uncharacterized membrane protein
MKKSLKKNFITGLLTLLPIVITIWVLTFVIQLLTKPFMGLMTRFLTTRSWIYLPSERAVYWTSQILILLALFFLLWVLGFIARYFFFKSLIHFGDMLLHKIPIINKLYRSFQEIIHSLFISDTDSFKQVVLIPFPNKESYCLGLVSRSAPETCAEKKGKELVSVLLPSTPNPVNGFLLMFPRKDLIYLDMTTEEALKYIISCGVILPEGKKS